MSEAEDDRIIADTRRRLLRRAFLNVAVALATVGGELFFGLRLKVLALPLHWQAVAVFTGLALLFGALGMIGSWWVTRLPPEALTPRITLRQSERIQRFLSRIFLFFPLIMGVLGVTSSALVIQVLNHGWRLADGVGAVAVLAGGAGYLLLLTGWGSAKRARLIYDEELFLSFRTRGYIAGFWSVMAGLLLVLALGLARPAWAVEALPLLIAAGVCVPAMTIALLNRRAERDA
ncbi:MAG TPA: hypothetical protein VLI41_10280 [Phenylobacterium sp.]|uniref:hypothetical protein n=1 Tax=Phenylobacterium sp. TaxID=1871053 RepID=UPI002CB9B529|nr:hypothetical protein [Phenylobacterium sp.]HSV03579.1 hypothetical protein [Phenylobacterium sp.]